MSSRRSATGTHAEILCDTLGAPVPGTDRIVWDHGVTRPPSLLARAWGASAVAPSRLVLLADPYVGAATDEDAFSGGEGGDWVWYPLAGSMRPKPLLPWWRIAGGGAGAVGTLTRREGRARFVPARFWQRRGVPEWERTIESERADGRWLIISFDDGEVVLRCRDGDAP